MKKSNKEIPLIYIYVYCKFLKNLAGTPFVRPAYLIEIMRRVCRVPKILNYPILNEMVKCSLLKRHNKQSWEVLRHPCINKLKGYHFKPERSPWN